jgi:carbonic anhydrase/acetyltransferase-like protein (isoleucine patch superfamily)
MLRDDDGEFRVGARTSIQDGTVLHSTAEHPTVIGAGCVVGLLEHLEGCTAGDRYLIGSNSVVLNRVVIGDGSLVGAGALVPEGTEVPADSRTLGVPARDREGPGIAAQIDYSVPLSVENARRYRTHLVQIS